MNEDQFSAMLAIIVPPIIEQITKNSNVDDEKAILTACLTPECTRELLEKSQIILQTLLEALQAIARDYPRNVRIIFKERRKYTCSA